MRVPYQPGAREQRRVDERCVIQPVLEHAIAASGERSDDAEVGEIAAREQQCARALRETRQLLFEAVMFLAMPADEMRSAASRGSPRVGQRITDARIARKAQIVVTAENDAFAAFHHGNGRSADPALDDPPAPLTLRGPLPGQRFAAELFQ